MLKYLDLNLLEIKETEEDIITKGVHFRVEDNMSLKDLQHQAEVAVDRLLMDLDQDKIYNFAFDILLSGNEVFEVQDFESTVNVILSVFFRTIKLNEGRPRERRLDVPENLKTEVNCNMSLLKNAINHKTITNRFQLEITSRSLLFRLVGGYDE